MSDYFEEEEEGDFAETDMAVEDEAMVEAALDEVVPAVTLDEEEDYGLDDGVLLERAMEERRAVLEELAIARDACTKSRVDLRALVRRVSSTGVVVFEGRKELLGRWFLAARHLLRDDVRLPAFSLEDPSDHPSLEPYFCPATRCIEVDWWLTETGGDVSGPALVGMLKAGRTLKDPVTNTPFESVVFNMSRHLAAKAALSAIQPDAATPWYTNVPFAMPDMDHRRVVLRSAMYASTRANPPFWKNNMNSPALAGCFTNLVLNFWQTTDEEEDPLPVRGVWEDEEPEPAGPDAGAGAVGPGAVGDVRAFFQGALGHGLAGAAGEVVARGGAGAMLAEEPMLRNIIEALPEHMRGAMINVTDNMLGRIAEDEQVNIGDMMAQVMGIAQGGGELGDQ